MSEISPLREAVQIVYSARPLKCPHCKSSDVNLVKGSGKRSTIWLGRCGKCHQPVTQEFRTPIDAAYAIAKLGDNDVRRDS